VIAFALGVLAGVGVVNLIRGDVISGSFHLFIGSAALLNLAGVI